MTETITQTIRRLIIDDGLDPDVAADKALGAVPRTKLAEFARPLALSEARRVARHITRRIEDAAFSHPPTSGYPTSTVPTSEGGEPRLTTSEARQALIAARFVTPDGRWVTWGQATADDHRARAEWQRGQAYACSTDAARHEHAAHLITTNDVACLDDIDGWGDLLDREAA